MMSRRRALLIIEANENLPYDVTIIPSMVIHQAENETKQTTWYVCYEFETDNAAGIFTMTDPVALLVDYNDEELFNYQMRSSYCIPGASSGSEMYFFPSNSSCTKAYNEATGIYSITAHGSIKKLTPKASS